MAGTISWLARRSNQNRPRELETLVQHYPKLSFCWNELTILHHLVVLPHLVHIADLELIEAMVREDEVLMLVEDKTNSSWVAAVWADKGRGSVVLMLGTLDQDTTVFQLKGQAANFSHVAAKDLPVVHGLEGDGVVHFS